ncbi:MAG: hypothetical protein NZ480_05775 [Bdellovibrionaceae bacterium]|nr:hypothetical protein [Pseudobdellovibrionaceae bacterium]MDW8190957.1 hypothetical protein [Pseudobdellovibrionaceae bacterium]
MVLPKVRTFYVDKFNLVLNAVGIESLKNFEGDWLEKKALLESRLKDVENGLELIRLMDQDLQLAKLLPTKF